MRMTDSRVGRGQPVKVEEVLGRQLNDVEKKYAPPTLYAMGAIELPIPSPRVAIVGTREPSSTGVDTAYALAKYFAAKDVAVISGLARGIDTAAHLGAIENGGKTIAVLGTPLDRSYPPQNAGLQKLIAKGHLVLSQFASEHSTQRKDFVLRNRTMALLCDASITISAGHLSEGMSKIVCQMNKCLPSLRASHP